MAKHNIEVELPRVEVVNSDARIVIRADGKKLGELTLSRGNLKWFSHKWKKPTKLSWKRFDQIMKDEWTH
jgi:hypothetical protein